MFKLTTHHLSADGRHADAAHGDQARGELDAAAFAAVCGNFLQLDPVQNHSHDPHLAVQGPGGRFIVRLNHGKLYAYDARDIRQPAVAVEVADLLALLAPAGRGKPASEETPEWTPADEQQARRKSRWGAALLVVGLALNATAVTLLLQPPDKDPPVAYEPVIDHALLAAHRRQITGLYATGAEPGDHRIMIRADGSLSLQDLGEGGRVTSDTLQSYVIGRHAGRLCLVVGDATTRLEVLSTDTLLYCGDTFHRVQP